MQPLTETGRRQSRGRWLRSARLVLLGAGLLAGAAGSHAGRLPRYGGSLQLELSLRPADMGALDPLALWGDDGSILSSCLFEGLTRWGDERIEPGLAVQWVHNDEATRWLFELHPDARFHDGARCDAQSVSESLHRLADPRQSLHAWLLRDLVGLADYAAGETPQIEGIYVLSATEIELQFVRPVQDLPARLALPEAAIARRSGTSVVGTGPFRVVTAVPETLRCAAFEPYYDGRPFLAALAVLGRSADAARPRITLSMHRLDPTTRPAAGSVRVRAEARRLALALVHPGSAAFASAPRRQRLAVGFDAAVFVRAGLAGDGAPAFGLYPDATTLRSAPGTVTGEQTTGSTRHAVRILVPAAEPVLHKLAERLQVQLAQLAFDANLESRPAATYAAALSDGRYDIALLGWTPPQGHAEDLQEEARVLHVLSHLLAPVLREQLPPVWRDVLAGRASATEPTLMASGHLIPLVFFHEVWEAPDTAQSLRLAAGTPSPALADVHLQPASP